MGWQWEPQKSTAQGIPKEHLRVGSSQPSPNQHPLGEECTPFEMRLRECLASYAAPPRSRSWACRSRRPDAQTSHYGRSPAFLVGASRIVASSPPSRHHLRDSCLCLRPPADGKRGPHNSADVDEIVFVSVCVRMTRRPDMHSCKGVLNLTALRARPAVVGRSAIGPK